MVAAIIGTTRRVGRWELWSCLPRMVRRLPVAVLFMLLLAGTSWAQTAPDAAKVLSPGGYEALAGKLAQQGTVRIIVKLNMEFQSVADAASVESVHQMARIASKQGELLASLGDAQPKTVHTYRYIPSMFMEVDAGVLRRVLASPLTADVHEDILAMPVLNQSVPRIGAPQVWSAGYKGTGVVTAVLDTGVDKTHPFLIGSVVSEACYSSSNYWDNISSICPNGGTESTEPGSALPYAGGCPTGQCDHGTHVAGIIAGRQGVPVARGPGVAPEAGIIAIQVFTSARSPFACPGGRAPCVGSFTSDQIKGLERVYTLRSTYPISSVNMSLGDNLYRSACDDDPRKAIIDNLRAAGIATVVATGNEDSCGAIAAPACISTAVSVGATTDSDQVADYSNSARFQSLLAPGSFIYASIPGGFYEIMSGTSMATPHVTGAWALLKQARPNATVDQVLAALTSTGLSVTDDKCIFVTKKRINVYETLNTLAGRVDGVTLTPNLSSPQPAGTSVTFTATASGPAGSPLYQFYVCTADGACNLVRAYSAVPTWTWNTVSLAAGTYMVQVWAKNEGSDAAYEAFSLLNYTFAAPPPASSVTITPDKVSPQRVGTGITFTAASSGGSGSYQYQFYRKNPGGSWAVVRPYSATPTWTWNTAGLSAGAYQVQVWAKNTGSSASYEAFNMVSYTLTWPPASSVTLTPSLSSPRPVGTGITFTAAASGGSGSYQYQFYRKNPGGSWTVVRPYSATPTWTWNTVGLSAGTYQVQVWAKNSGSGASYEAYRNMNYALQ